MAKSYKTKNGKHEDSYMWTDNKVELQLRGDLDSKVNNTEESSKISVRVMVCMAGTPDLGAAQHILHAGASTV